MNQKIQIVDMVRTYSILLVLVIHQWDRALPPKTPWLWNLWSDIAHKGYYGVSLFFVVSGFLITRLIDTRMGGLEQMNWRLFYTRRVARIIPLLALIVLWGAGMAHWVKVNPSPTLFFFKNPHTVFNLAFWFSIATFSFNWLLMTKQSSFVPYGLHWDVLWSLSIEEQFYLFYPLVLYFFGSKKRLPFILGGVILAGIAAQVIAYLLRPNDLFFSFMNSFTGFEAISIGAVLYLVNDKYQADLSKKPFWCVLFCLLGMLMMFSIFPYPYGDKDLIWSPTLVDVGLFLFLLGGFHLAVFEPAHGCFKKDGVQPKTPFMDIRNCRSVTFGNRRTLLLA